MTSPNKLALLTGGSSGIGRGAALDLAPVGRRGWPEGAAAALVWLRSEGASFVIGQTIAVDGGGTAP